MFKSLKKIAEVDRFRTLFESNIMQVILAYFGVKCPILAFSLNSAIILVKMITILPQIMFLRAAGNLNLLFQADSVVDSATSDCC